MKNFFALILCLFMFNGIVFASNYQHKQFYKLNEYNSRGQKVGYTKVYYQGDRQNVKKVEKYSTNGKRINVYK